MEGVGGFERHIQIFSYKGFFINEWTTVVRGTLDPVYRNLVDVNFVSVKFVYSVVYLIIFYNYFFIDV